MAEYIFAIDPGNEKSAYAELDSDLRPVRFGLVDNRELLNMLRHMFYDPERQRHFAIEMVASYGMPVGKEVFYTCVWIGRFWQAIVENYGVETVITPIYRMQEKMMLCHDSRAKDANIRQALIDRFGPVGTKSSPGWFYGVKKDIWSAIAVGVTYADIEKEKRRGK